MKRILVTIVTALLVAAFLNTPVTAQDATATPLDTTMATDVPQIEITPVPPVGGSTATDVAESALDTVQATIIAAGTVIVTLVLASVAALVALANINAKAVADAIPRDLALKWLGLGEIGAKLTPDTKDDAEIAAAKQKLIEAYGDLTEAVNEQAADMRRDASHTPRG